MQKWLNYRFRSYFIFSTSKVLISAAEAWSSYLFSIFLSPLFMTLNVALVSSYINRSITITFLHESLVIANVCDTVVVNILIRVQFFILVNPELQSSTNGGRRLNKSLKVTFISVPRNLFDCRRLPRKKNLLQFDDTWTMAKYSLKKGNSRGWWE